MDEAMAENNAFLDARGFSSSSAPRHNSATGSILDSLEDIRSGNTVPLASPTGSVESDTPAGILKIMDQARGLEGEGTMAWGGRYHTLERAVRALTVLVGQQGDEIIALQDKLSSRRRRFAPPPSTAPPAPASPPPLYTLLSSPRDPPQPNAAAAPSRKAPLIDAVPRNGAGPAM